MTESVTAQARALCRAIWTNLAEATGRHAEIVFGPDLEASDELHARRLRERGAPFSWVAVAPRGLDFWDVHVGIVVDLQTLRARAGLHRGEEAKSGELLFAALEAQRAGRGLVVLEASLAEEMQFVGVERSLCEPGAITALCAEAAALITWAEAAGAALGLGERNGKS